VTPRYAERNFAEAETGKLHLIASKTGRDGSMEIHQDADLLLGKLDAGQSVKHSLAKERHAWIHVAEGEVNINGTKLTGGDAIGISDENVLNIAASKPSQVLLFDLN
jgi:quercetin 2,3-dioxygenase